MSAPSSTRSLRTFCPSGPVWWVFSCIPKMEEASLRTSSRDFATLTPPPLPRPPAWICAFTTQTLPPSFFAASTAWSTLNAGKPRGVGTPYFLKISLPWYSWIFTLPFLCLYAARPLYHLGYHTRTVSVLVSSAWHWSSWTGLAPSSRSEEHTSEL